MRTVVTFAESPRAGARNRVITRTLRKVGMVDVKYPADQPQPKPGETWLVEVVRENLAADSPGAFILQPVSLLRPEEVTALQLNDFTSEVYGTSLVLTPKDATRKYLLHDTARREIQEKHTAIESVLVHHGGDLWPRRKPPEAALGRARLPISRGP